MATTKNKTPAPLASAKTAWVISDGTKGMEVQSLGLAERMRLEVEVIRVDASALVSKFSRLALLPFTPMPRPMAEAAQKGWPDVVITTGRRMAGFSMLARRLSKGVSQTIHIQDPKLPPHHFDWMIVPSHDKVRGDNVLVTTGSLNALTSEKIASTADTLPEIIYSLPKPVIAFMVGGSNRRYQVTMPDYFALGQFAGALAHAKPVSLVFILSRRTLDEASEAIRAAIKTARSSPAFYIWEGEGRNPYPGILGHADAMVVTSDSVNMTSEACFSGKPVYSYSFRDEGGRIALFHRIMEKGGYTKDAKSLSPYSFPGPAGPLLDETGRIASLLTGRNI